MNLPGTEQPPSQTPAQTIPSRALWRGAILAFTLWVVALALLAFRTANPPQLNLAQLAQATLLVKARVVDLPQGEVEVLRSWSPGEPPARLKLSNLSATSARTGEVYVLPLARDRLDPQERYRVVEVHDRGIPPLIYPAAPDLESQIDAWQRPAK